jgi:hypothetical protein
VTEKVAEKTPKIDKQLIESIKFGSDNLNKIAEFLRNQVDSVLLKIHIIKSNNL